MTDLLEHFQEQFQRAHAGQPWYGPSRHSLLEGLSPEEAAAHPIAGAHSIWELVLHMTAWTGEVSRRIGGAEPATPPEGDWPAVGKVAQESWSAALKRLDAAHEELLAQVAKLDAVRLDSRVGTSTVPSLGTGVSVAGMIAGLGEHDAYHCGQIALLKRALAAAAEPGN
jgi:uncharacterized damage-inducible protein DinB